MVETYALLFIPFFYIRRIAITIMSLRVKMHIAFTICPRAISTSCPGCQLRGPTRCRSTSGCSAHRGQEGEWLCSFPKRLNQYRWSLTCNSILCQKKLNGEVKPTQCFLSDFLVHSVGCAHAQEETSPTKYDDEAPVVSKTAIPFLPGFRDAEAKILGDLPIPAKQVP